ncbi:HAMP domain-containing sensor histidine kinase [Streptomyces sp. NPDC000594]|uniref:HAMP domain-containing sensor histidine kinase n=1 Tax=Streptomyces sp. NPDC000594 TaxID=3154261 RepID=UPI003318F327
MHTPPGTEASVSVTTEDGVALVTVADTGPGIPSADRDRVFGRFSRVDRARTRNRAGSCLGLSVADSLIRAHSGTIERVSSPDETVFTVRLPLPRGAQPTGHLVNGVDGAGWPTRRPSRRSTNGRFQPLGLLLGH